MTGALPFPARSPELFGPGDLPAPLGLPRRPGPPHAPHHPAKFTPAILDVVAAELAAEANRRGLDRSDLRVLDPFAGTGRVHLLSGATVGVELEPEWAAMAPGTLLGDARLLPFGPGSFDAVATSPAYGNRLADHHAAKDGSVRRSYTHTLGRALTAGNAGTMPYRDRQGDDAPYRVLNRVAWAEVRRVLVAGGMLVVNVSDFVAGGERQHVTDWHVGVLGVLGFTVERTRTVETPRLRYGANRQRVSGETVVVLRAPRAVS